MSKNEQRLEVTVKSHLGFINKIKLHGWDNIETARGKKFGLLVLDEIDSMRAFEKHWREILRPTLADTKGAAIFMGTPKGYRTLYRLETKAKNNPLYEVFHFTSYDNPYLDTEEIEAMREDMTPSQFAQEVMAEYKKMEGLVYEEFNRDKHMVKLPFEPERYGISIDFGYNHPLAAHIFAIGSDDSLHIMRTLYKSKLDDEQRATAIRDLIGDTELDVLVADSEDPIAIASLNRELNINLQAAVKGKGSVDYGIKKVKTLFHKKQLTMEPDCEDLAWELENYQWKLDINGDATDQPVKENDDAVDSMRYFVTAMFANPQRNIGSRISL